MSFEFEGLGFRVWGNNLPESGGDNGFSGLGFEK